MLKLLILTALLATSYARNFPRVQRQGGRIVNGEPADISEAPYQIAVLIGSTLNPYSHHCGGSLIAADVVLSAAHCSYGTTARQWRLRAGSTLSNSGGVVKSVSGIVNHEMYVGGAENYDYDISIYIASSPFIPDNELIAVIPLPEQDAPIITGSDAFITGWGDTSEDGESSEELLKITIPIVDWDACNQAHQETGGITRRHICAGDLEENEQDSCQGDSGGPLAIDGVIIGIVSSGDGCAKPGKPGLYTNVPMLRDWIDSAMSKH